MNGEMVQMKHKREKCEVLKKIVSNSLNNEFVHFDIGDFVSLTKKEYEILRELIGEGINIEHSYKFSNNEERTFNGVLDTGTIVSFTKNGEDMYGIDVKPMILDYLYLWKLIEIMR